MRRRIIAGNWKMNLGEVPEARDFVRKLRSHMRDIQGVDIVLCPPFTALYELAQVLANSTIELGAQTMHWNNKGAHTGDISPGMLQDLCRYVILGHSERRATGSKEEDNDAIQHKVAAAHAHQLIPILCVGENLTQNEAGETRAFVREQVQTALTGLTPEEVMNTIIAYEPIWAIGTGKAATPAEVNSLIGMTIRGAVADLAGTACGDAIRIMYGGSVKKDNIAAFIAMPEIDGALVGGASLTLDFAALVRNAASA